MFVIGLLKLLQLLQAAQHCWLRIGQQTNVISYCFVVVVAIIWLIVALYLEGLVRPTVFFSSPFVRWPWIISPQIALSLTTFSLPLSLVFTSNGTANKMNGALDHSDQPDPDAIKMFVGQIPRSWSEKELKELFEPYGAVYQINVLRDRSQNPPQSKGKGRLAPWTIEVFLLSWWASPPTGCKVS